MLVTEHVQAAVMLVGFLFCLFSKTEAITLRKLSFDGLFAFNFKLFSYLFFFELEYIYVNNSERNSDEIIGANKYVCARIHISSSGIYFSHLKKLIAFALTKIHARHYLRFILLLPHF